MRRGPRACLALACALAVAAGCSGGGDEASTTTLPTEPPSTLAEPTTTSTPIDPALQQLLLVAADLPDFEESAPAGSPDEPSSCDPATAPAYMALEDDPSADGATFERGSGPAGPVQVSSEVSSSSPAEAEAALDELLDPELTDCLEADLLEVVQPDPAPGATPTVKLTASKSTVSGADQTVLLSSTITVEGGSTPATLRSDLVLLRSGGTILRISYGGPSTMTTVAERQRIVAIAARKLAEASGGTGTGTGSSTSSTKASGRSTTSTRRTSSTRRSTTTTRRSTTSTTGSTSTTA